MARRNRQKFRPMLEAAEARVYLSAAGVRPSILPSSGLINLKTPEFTKSLRNSLLGATPKAGREQWTLSLLEASPSTGMVYGAVTINYNAQALPGILNNYGLRIKTKVNIAFATPLDSPKASDVNVAVSENVAEFTSSVRHTIALGVIEFIQANHNTIASEMEN